MKTHTKSTEISNANSNMPDTNILIANELEGQIDSKISNSKTEKTTLEICRQLRELIYIS